MIRGRQTSFPLSQTASREQFLHGQKRALLGVKAFDDGSGMDSVFIGGKPFFRGTQTCGTTIRSSYGTYVGNEIVIRG